MNEQLRNVASLASRMRRWQRNGAWMRLPINFSRLEARQRQLRADAASQRAEEQRIQQTEMLAALNALSGEQSQTLSAMQNFGAEQAQALIAIRTLSEELAEERRAAAGHEAMQQIFNRRMSWAALLLAGAAVVVPFAVILLQGS